MAPSHSKVAKEEKKNSKKVKKVEKGEKVEKAQKGKAIMAAAAAASAADSSHRKSSLVRKDKSPSSTTASSAPSKRCSFKQTPIYVYGTPPDKKTGAIQSPAGGSKEANEKKQDCEEVPKKDGKPPQKEKKEKKGKKEKNEPPPKQEFQVPKKIQHVEPEPKKRKADDFEKQLAEIEAESEAADEEDVDDQTTLELGAPSPKDVPSTESSSSESADEDEEGEEEEPEEAEDSEEDETEEEEEKEEQDKGSKNPKGKKPEVEGKGALPSLDVQQESAMAEALTGGATKVKKNKTPKDDSAVKVEPATVKEKAEDCKEDILREGGEARRYAVSLKGLSYGDKLVDELFAHSAKMEKMYEAISNLLAAGSNNDGKYSKIIDLYKEHSQWFEKAKAAAKGLLSGLKKKKSKSKAKAKPGKEETAKK